MIKRIVACSLVALALLGGVSGCITKIQVIDDGSSSTNKVQKVESGFNEETYVWESWLFSTDRVDK